MPIYAYVETFMTRAGPTPIQPSGPSRFWRSTQWRIAATVAAAAIAIAGFIPFEDSPTRIADRVLVLEVILCVASCGWLVITKDSDPAIAKQPISETALPRAPDGSLDVPLGARWPAIALWGWIALVWLILWHVRLLHPVLVADDFSMIAESQSFSNFATYLFSAQNEHLVVPVRLLTWLLCSLSPERYWPGVMVAGGGILFVGTWPLLYRLLRVQTKSTTAATIGVLLFAITTAHREVVEWYAASQWIWGLYAVLGTLVVLQTDDGRLSRNCGAGVPPACPCAGGTPAPTDFRIGIACLLSALGPMCFWIGAAAGPIATVYLWSIGPLSRNRNDWVRIVLPAFTAIVSVGLVQKLIWTQVEPGNTELRHMHWSTIERVFVFAGRFAVDRLMLANLGLPNRVRDWQFGHAVWFGGLVTCVVGVMMASRSRRRFAVGIAAIVIGYAIVFPFRVWIGTYEPGILQNSRYQLLPQFGLAWCAAVALGTGQYGAAQRTALSVKQATLIAMLAALLYCIQRTQV